MAGTYIFFAISVAGAAYLCWCFVELHHASKRKLSTYKVGRYPDDFSNVAVGHHCIVFILDGVRIPATPDLDEIGRLRFEIPRNINHDDASISLE